MDYSATIDVAADPATANLAIRQQMDMWWSSRVELSPNGATVRFRRSHVSFAFDPDSTALHSRWPCTDANMIIEDVADHSEWTGTALIWDIAPNGTGARVTLTHEGLNHTLECHDVCVRGWEHFFEQSLRAHLDGKPAMREES